MKERPSRQGGAGSGRGPGVPAAGAGGAHGSPEWQGRRGGPGVGQATEDHPDVPVGRRALSRRHRAQLAQVGVQGQAGEAAGGPRAQRGPATVCPEASLLPVAPPGERSCGSSIQAQGPVPASPTPVHPRAVWLDEAPGEAGRGLLPEVLVREAGEPLSSTATLVPPGPSSQGPGSVSP